MSADQLIFRLENTLDYRFADPKLCLEAMQMSGMHLVWNGQFIRIQKNENLAVLGNKILDMILCKEWIESGASKGKWNTAQQAVVKSSNLSDVGNSLSLHECIILNPGTRTASPAMIATTVQALIGATYLDGGEEAAHGLVITMGLMASFLDHLG